MGSSENNESEAPVEPRAVLAGRVTPTERLLIWRRREKLSQAKAAERFGIKTYEYRRIESGEGDLPPGFGVPSVRDLTVAERCVIRRVRAGMTVGAVAVRSGLSRCWIQQVERGIASPKALAKFWAKAETAEVE